MKKLVLPDELALKNPESNLFENKEDPRVIEYVSLIKHVQKKAQKGELYIKFIDGDRKGSIAKVIPNEKSMGKDAIRDVEIEERYERPWNSREYSRFYRIQNDHFYVIATWEKRSNRVQLTLPSDEIVFLPNYTGPTVWSLFDSKSAKAKVLSNPNQKDIDGRILKIGDEVLYINARYGSGMELNHGKIKEFKAEVNSKRAQIWTVVERNSDQEISTIRHSEEMIYKKTL